MDRQTLESILKKPYNQTLWRQVLTEVFGARNLAQNPPEITNLPPNKWNAKAFELGSLVTSDERIIGLYQVNLNATAKIERNRVTLRNLLRKIYKYDVDGALVVFVQNDKWRLSFISEIRVLNEDGTASKKETEPKRYTYLLGEGEKVKTPAARLFELAGKRFSLEDIRERFSVEVLNKEFYEKVARSFYQLVGDTEGKGKKKISYERILELPGVDTKHKDTDRFYKEFAVRLIGRIIFCWFLREKMPDGGGKPLMPPELLSLDAVKRTENYYHNILEPLFFQILNTPIDKRRDDLPAESEQIPFLNGGLFEPHDSDYYEINKITGFSKYINTLKVPNEWFEDFFKTLEEYNFTIDENSTTDIFYGIDPEMLGRIFENLLAAIDQDTGQMARKATGSFYTPREIVDYMVTESLVLYLHNETGVDKDKLHDLFKVVTETKFDKDEREILLDALDRLKILDPACGSGAFPIGVLQKITLALAKLDENAEWWKARQLKQINNAIIRRKVKEKLDSTNAEYIRKFGIIQNTLYGVDIQPIATEISKLRCFLTLIVDENVDDEKPNRGIEHLPNLEFKFVTADALLKLPESSSQRGFFDSDEQLERLHEIRQEYLQAYGDEKQELKERFEELQKEIADQQDKNIRRDPRADALSSWKPFSYERTDWFDPEWMFGVKDFDIVIGNPPYGAKLDPKKIKRYKEEFELKTSETAILFIEKGYKLLKANGIENFLTPKSFSFASNYDNARNFIGEDLVILGDCGKAFEKVKFEVCMILAQKSIKLKSYASVKFDKSKRFREISTISKGIKDIFGFFPNGISDEEIKIGLQIIKVKQSLNDIAVNSRGEMLQQFINPTGKIKVIGGKEIDKYSVRSIKGFLEDLSLVGKKGVINKNSVLVQNIIAHINNPIDHIQITACIPQDYSFAILDTINQITISNNTYTKQIIWALLNSKLVNWYAYRFIFGKAIRTMHFDNSVTSRIPIPLISSYEMSIFKNLVDYIIFLKSQPLEDVTDKLMPIYFEQIIDGMVYELYLGELLREHGREIIKHLGELPEINEDMSDAQKMETIRDVFKRLNDREHPVRINLFYLDSIPEIRLIEGKDANN